MKLFAIAGLSLFLVAAPASAQQSWWPDGWKDTNSHRTRFVEVEPGVKLEVLDWGGTGRPLIFLAGLGRTAHNFDEFAPKLLKDFRVYAITRRGYGYSTLTDSGYDVDRLGDDVVAVIDALKLKQALSGPYRRRRLS
jgi:non-heme chloroperoxidase